MSEKIRNQSTVTGTNYQNPTYTNWTHTTTAQQTWLNVPVQYTNTFSYNTKPYKPKGVKEWVMYKLGVVRSAGRRFMRRFRGRE
jgi:hypothetical protein